ncbi:MAG TPA: hypothetical protein VGX37_06085 [Allosphingosinicella sp.]|nr:hypothetical protein [Allosphingosinicella sp.]
MAVYTIDGTLEEAVLKRVRRNLRVYERLTFRQRDGTTKSIAKAVVDARVAERLLPGTSGRFYLYTAIDHRGVHGIRDDSGRAIFGYPMNNEKAMIWTIPIMVVMIALLMMVGKIPLLAVLALIISVPAFFFYRRTRMEATKQFQGDSGYAASPGAAAEPVLGA